MKITIGEANRKGVGFDLDTLLVTRLLIQANSGAGKSWLLRKLIEQLYGHVQVIAIDPEGEFATLREKYDFVLVGAGGETPADVRSAGLLAEKLLELRASAVCDLYEMRPLDRHLWVKAFLEAMVNAPKKLWHPCVVVVDEAQLFCPQDGESKAEEAMVSLTTRGRKRGFCAVWATQRLAKVNKDATSMLLNRLVGGTFEDVDIKRALDLLSVAPEDKRDVSQQLRTLDPGWFFAFGRAVSKERLLFKVGQVETSHPQPGSAKHAAAPPPAPAKIKGLLPQLADLPQAAEEKARTIAELQRDLRTTRAQLAAKEREKPADPVPADPNRINVAVEKAVRASLKERDVHWTRTLRDYQRGIEGAIGKAAKAFEGAVHTIPISVPPPIGEISSEVEVVTRPMQSGPSLKGDNAPRAVGQRAGSETVRAIAESNGHLSNSQLRILGALAQFEGIGRTPVPKKWIAALAGASHSSSAYGNNLGYLRSGGYIDYPSPGVVALTEVGREKAPEVQPPSTTAEMIERCKQIISGSQARILDALVQAYTEVLSKAALADCSGALSTSSAYGNNLGALRSAGMIDYPDRGQVRAADWLFLEGR
jgi:hypothetical protein